MKLFYTLLFVFLLCFESFCQSFSLPELMKMSKMNLDDFDTYVSSKGFVFFEGQEDEDVKGVTYAYDLSKIDNTKASKWINLFQKYYHYRYSIDYRTTSKSEYIKIKDQIKQLGFKLTVSEVYKDKDGKSSNHFEYRKGKSKVSIFADSGYEISYLVNY
jgi:tRNA G10  N-methylase Trm11